MKAVGTIPIQQRPVWFPLNFVIFLLLVLVLFFNDARLRGDPGLVLVRQLRSKNDASHRVHDEVEVEDRRWGDRGVNVAHRTKKHVDDHVESYRDLIDAEFADVVDNVPSILHGFNKITEVLDIDVGGTSYHILLRTDGNPNIGLLHHKAILNLGTCDCNHFLHLLEVSIDQELLGGGAIVEKADVVQEVLLLGASLVDVLLGLGVLSGMWLHVLEFFGELEDISFVPIHQMYEILRALRPLHQPIVLKVPILREALPALVKDLRLQLLKNCLAISTHHNDLETWQL